MYICSMFALASQPTQNEIQTSYYVCKVWGDMALACIYCFFTQINDTALGLPETSQTLLISFLLNSHMPGTPCSHLWRAGSSCSSCFHSLNIIASETVLLITSFKNKNIWIEISQRVINSHYIKKTIWHDFWRKFM